MKNKDVNFEKNVNENEEVTKSRLKRRWIIALAIVGIIVAVIYFVPSLNQEARKLLGAFRSMEDVRDYIQGFGTGAMLVSAAMMVIASVISFIPQFFITLANAAIWGWKTGALLSWSSAMVGAALCFFISRFLGRDITERLASRKGLIEVEKFFDRFGTQAILVARLLPFMSFDLVSYAAGLTPMSFLSFFVATGIGQTPATIVYSYAAATSTQVGSIATGLMIFFAVAILSWMIKQVWDSRRKAEAEEASGEVSNEDEVSEEFVIKEDNSESLGQDGEEIIKESDDDLDVYPDQVIRDNEVITEEEKPVDDNEVKMPEE